MIHLHELRFFHILASFLALFKPLGQAHLQYVFEKVWGEDNVANILTRPESYGLFSLGYSRKEVLQQKLSKWRRPDQSFEKGNNKII